MGYGRPVPTDADTVAEIARLREIIAKYGITNKAALMAGRTKMSLSLIARGIRHGRVGSIRIESLELRYSDKLCRRCGNVAGIITKTMLCIVCDLRDLARQGVIEIQPENENEQQQSRKTG